MRLRWRLGGAERYRDKLWRSFTLLAVLLYWPIDVLAPNPPVRPIYTAPTTSLVENSIRFLEPFSFPSCEAQYSQSPVFSVSGDVVARPHGDVYCLQDSTSNDRLIELLKRTDFPYSSVTELRISATYVKDPTFASALCDLGLSTTADTTLYYQKSTGPATTRDQPPHFDIQFLTELQSCLGAVNIKPIGCDLYPDSSICPKKVTNTHHIKSLLFITPDSSLTLLGSGNISKNSLRFNIEDWVGYIEVGSDPSASTCIFSVLDALYNNHYLRFSEQKRTYYDCLDQSRALPFGVNHVILPFDQERYKNRLSKLFKDSDKIVITGQFLESKFLLSLIQKSTNLDITIVLDDAYYYTATTLFSQNFIKVENAQDVMNLGRMQHVELRFLQTNHHFDVHGSRNTVHLRTIFFIEQDLHTVMIGSAHFRDGSWRNNTEVQVFLSGHAAETRKEFLTELLERSVTISELPELNVAANRVNR